MALTGCYLMLKYVRFVSYKFEISHIVLKCEPGRYV